MADATATCAGCVHFCADAERIERELPGLSALSSAYASVRAQDGLCLRHDRLTAARGTCPAHAAVGHH